MWIGISWIKGPHNYQYQEPDSLNWGPEGKLYCAITKYNGILNCDTRIEALCLSSNGIGCTVPCHFVKCHFHPM